MPVTVDIVGLDQVIMDLREESGQFNSFLQQYYYQELRDRTPIRTGRARRGWIAETRGGLRDRLIYNKVPYIQYLEAGHSKQAPRGFVRQSQYAAIEKAAIRFEEFVRRNSNKFS